MVCFSGTLQSKMNAYLKELADICGIKKTLTTHTARHTFATFALANGVSIESVAKMLGHTNVQMTRHYARVLDRTVIREMSQIKMDFHFHLIRTTVLLLLNKIFFYVNRLIEYRRAC